MAVIGLPSPLESALAKLLFRICNPFQDHGSITAT